MTSGVSIARSSIEARTIRKLRFRILPFVFLLFIVALLDRFNIGFAALTMNKELGITSQQYGLVFGIFFVGYFIFELPSNLLLHKIGARIWIARILISWGILASLTGLVHTVHQLYVVRFLLGLAEAGYFPGIVLYLTYWFRQREQAQALAFLLMGIPITSIVGAPISGLILDQIHWLGLSSWRWLLILEAPKPEVPSDNRRLRPAARLLQHVEELGDGRMRRAGERAADPIEHAAAGLAQRSRREIGKPRRREVPAQRLGQGHGIGIEVLVHYVSLWNCSPDGGTALRGRSIRGLPPRRGPWITGPRTAVPPSGLRFTAP
jgi:hypothetical protein